MFTGFLKLLAAIIGAAALSTFFAGPVYRATIWGLGAWWSVPCLLEGENWLSIWPEILTLPFTTDAPDFTRSKSVMSFAAGLLLLIFIIIFYIIWVLIYILPLSLVAWFVAGVVAIKSAYLLVLLFGVCMTLVSFSIRPIFNFPIWAVIGAFGGSRFQSLGYSWIDECSAGAEVERIAFTVAGSVTALIFYLLAKLWIRRLDLGDFI